MRACLRVVLTDISLLQGKTAAQGATATNQLVNLLDFFNQHIASELQAPASSSQDTGKAVLVADALKFVTTFRSHIPKATLVQLFPKLVEALGSPANVVHSYAAICIDRLLSSRVCPVRELSALTEMPLSWHRAFPCSQFLASDLQLPCFCASHASCCILLC